MKEGAMVPFKEQKLKILRCPSLMYNYSGIPPFGLATITAMLSQRGYQIEQDDLDAKCAADELFPRHRWGKQFPAKDLMLDIQRVRRFWDGGDDSAIIDVVEEVLSYTELDDIDCVLLSCIEGDDPSAVLALCIGKYLRDQHNKMVILGGEAFPHMMPVKSEIDYFYETGCFDYYIQGYGEVPLLNLFDALEQGQSLEKVNGLVYRTEDGERIENRPLFTRPEVIPDFDGLPMHLYYRLPDDWGNQASEDAGTEEILVLPVKLNFCCPMNCAFCISSGDAFTKVTWMQPDVVANAIKGLVEKYDTRYFMFADDLFNISRKFADEMADAFIRHDLDIMWSDCAYLKNLDLPLLQKIRKSGAIRLVWGVESTSPKMQKMIGKGIKMDEAQDILRWSHEAGIYNSVEIIAGLPHETDEDIDHTIEFLHRNRAYIDQMYLNPFSLITGSRMEKNPERFGITNVKPVATIFQRNPDEVYSWIQRYTFDEVNGHPWKDKIRQIEDSYRRLHQVQLELNLGGHDLHFLFHRFNKYKHKHLVSDFQTSREHQGFDYFGRDGQRGHSPAKSVVSDRIS
ncbi:MAG: B12-binding domain-containing radical SAM protein [Bradymonadia bacterium]